jgi:hypothetical protein
MPPSTLVQLFRTATIGSLVATWTLAQCQVVDQIQNGIGGVDNAVFASTLWDPDGAGPLTPQLVLGGSFTIAGGIEARRIVLCDPVTESWTPLGSGLDGPVHALAVGPNGDLYAGGNFSTAGGIPSSRLARWDGTAWHAIPGLGQPFYILHAIAFLPNGDLVVGGEGPAVGVLPGRIAKWNGVAWSWLGGDANDVVQALCTLPNGDLVAGGWFTSIGGTPAAGIARWNGTAWSPLGAGINGTVYALDVTPNGDLLAAGSFLTSGITTVNGVARWNGTTWLPLGSGCPGGVKSATVTSNGDVVVVGEFSSAGGQPARGIARWNGTTWSDMGTGTWAVTQFGRSVLELPNGELVVGKEMPAFWNAGPGMYVMRWTGAGWRAMGDGIDGGVPKLLTMPNGDDLVVGTFTRIGGVAAPFCARRSSSGWSALGPGLNGPVNAAAFDAAGRLIVAGSFTTAGGFPASGLARWDGIAWQPMSMTLAGTGSTVLALAILPNGDLIIGGRFTAVDGVAANNIARWDGSAWSPLGGGIQGSTVFVRCLLALPNGDVAVGGNVISASGPSTPLIARWGGGAWLSFGSLGTSGAVFSLEPLPTGDILALGNFFLPPSNSRNLARWDGTAWQPLGGGLGALQSDAIALPAGDLLATSEPVGGSAARLHRFHGGTWSQLAALPDAILTASKTNADGSVLAAVARRVGAGSGTSLVRLATTCPAVATPLGTACAGSAGTVTLTAETLPWTGTTFRTLATGFPANSLGLLAAGVATTNIPLANLVPQGLPGCALFVQPLVLLTVLPSGGSATSTLVLPNSAAVAGFVMHQQMVVVELGGSTGLSAFSSSNALSLTVGTF